MNQDNDKNEDSGKPEPLDTPPMQLAKMPREAFLDKDALARLFRKCTKSISRALRRGELPPPVPFLGKRGWTVEAILNHLTSRQQSAIQRTRKIDLGRDRHLP